MKKLKYEKQIMEMVSGDSVITCPHCNRISLEYYGYTGWLCLWTDCLYRNFDLPEIKETFTYKSKKVYADIYIDDRNFCFKCDKLKEI